MGESFQDYTGYTVLNYIKLRVKLEQEEQSDLGLSLLFSCIFFDK